MPHSHGQANRDKRADWILGTNHLRRCERLAKRDDASRALLKYLGRVNKTIEIRFRGDPMTLPERARQALGAI